MASAFRFAPLLAVAVLLTACPSPRYNVPAPPPAPTPAAPEAELSTIVIPVTASLDALEAELLADIENPIAEGSESFHPQVVYVQAQFTVLTKIVRTVCEWLPWPADSLCEHVVSFSEEVVTRVTQLPFPGEVRVDYEVFLRDVDLTAAGNRLRAQAEFEFALHLDLSMIPGIDAADIHVGRCASGGMGEATVTVTRALSLASNWQVEASGSGADDYDVRDCNLTFLGIDITDLLRLPIISGKIADEVDKLVDDAVPTAEGFREYAADAWDQLANPFALEDSTVWVAVRPQAIVASNPIGVATDDGPALHVALGLVGRPIATTGPAIPVWRADPLPCLRVASASPGFRLTLQGEIPFALAADAAKAALTRDPPAVFGRKVVVDDVDVYAAGDRVVIGIHVSDPIRATAYLHGTPRFDADRHEVYLDGLAYDVETRIALLEVVPWLFDSQVHAALDRELRWSTDSIEAQAQALTGDTVTEPLGSGFHLVARLDSVRISELFHHSNAFALRAVLSGVAHVVPSDSGFPEGALTAGTIDLDQPGSGPVRCVDVAPGRIRVVAGRSASLDAIPRDRQGRTLAQRPVAWQSLTPEHVFVDDTGLVTGVRPGEGRVRATADGRSGEAAVVVAPLGSAIGVEIHPDTVVMYQGERLPLQLRRFDERGVLIGGDAIWSAANARIADVTRNGLVEGRWPGTTRVVARATEGTADATVFVRPGATAVGAGWRWSCALLVHGRAYCWGGDFTTAPGRRATMAWLAPIEASFDTLAVGADMACGITADGSAYCWGRRARYLGGPERESDDDISWARVASDVPFQSITVGKSHACAVAMDRAAYCWGLNGYGVLGAGDQVPVSLQSVAPRPVRVAGSVQWKQLSAGAWHTCGIDQNGSVYCWGDASDGAVGNGVSSPYTTTPVLVPGVTAARSVAAGSDHSCALTGDGSVLCWGTNTWGQLGVENVTETCGGDVCSRVPVRARTRRAAIAAGERTTCAIDRNGVAECWGDYSRGYMGPGPIGGRSERIPATEPLRQLSIGDDHICAASDRGGIYCWGGNSEGQLGVGTTTTTLAGAVASPSFIGTEMFPLGESELVRWGRRERVDAEDVGPIVDFTVGDSHSCARSRSGRAYCWGDNRYGQLGAGLNVERAREPVAVAPTPPAFVQIAAGGQHTCGVTADSTAYCWGDNSAGQLGQGEQSILVHRPVPVVTNLRFSAITAGSDHTCAIATEGAVVCWGEHSQNGTYTPPRALGQIAPTAGAIRFRQIAAGGLHTCGVDEEGVAYCWGNNLSGAVGVADSGGVYLPTRVPVRVQTDVTFREVTAARSHSCGLSETGVVLCWGSSEVGQLGPDITSTVPLGYGSAVPVVVDLPEQAVDVDAGGDGSCAVMASGTVYCWGAIEDIPTEAINLFGDGPIAALGAPRRVASTSTFEEVEVGDNHVCGRTTGGQLLCWGRSEAGALGLGGQTIVEEPAPVRW